MDNAPRPSNIRLWFLLLLVYAAFFFQLGRYGFLGADEPRYARVAEEMLRGGDFVVPTLDGRPWLEKPPLYYWLAAAAFALLGEGPAPARLPSALAAAVLVLMTWRLVRRRRGPEPAFWTAVALATSPLLFVFARAASTDSLFSALFSLGLLWYLDGFVRERLPGFVLSGIALGLAALAKGPMAFLLAAPLAVSILVLHPTPRRIRGTALALAAGLATAAPWYVMILQRTGYEFVSVFLLNHHLARFLTDLHHHTQPFYYYLPVLLVGLFPWSLAVPAAAAASRRATARLGFAGWLARQARDPERVLLGVWILGLLLFFSASRAKLPAYVLPLAPPLCILAGAAMERLQGGAQRLAPARPLALWGIPALGTGVLIAFFLQRAYLASWRGVAAGAAVAVAGLLGALLARRSLAAGFLALAGGNVAVVLVLATAVLPVAEPYHSTRRVLQKALLEIPAGEPVFFYRTFHHTADYYSGRRMAGDVLETPQQVRERAAVRPSVWLLVERREVPRLQQAQPGLTVRVVSMLGTWAVVEARAVPAAGLRLRPPAPREAAGLFDTLQSRR